MTRLAANIAMPLVLVLVLVPVVVFSVLVVTRPSRRGVTHCSVHSVLVGGWKSSE